MKDTENKKEKVYISIVAVMFICAIVMGILYPILTRDKQSAKSESVKEIQANSIEEHPEALENMEVTFKGDENGSGVEYSIPATMYVSEHINASMKLDDIRKIDESIREKIKEQVEFNDDFEPDVNDNNAYISHLKPDTNEHLDIMVDTGDIKRADIHYMANCKTVDEYGDMCNHMLDVIQALIGADLHNNEDIQKNMSSALERTNDVQYVSFVDSIMNRLMVDFNVYGDDEYTEYNCSFSISIMVDMQN